MRTFAFLAWTLLLACLMGCGGGGGGSSLPDAPTLSFSASPTTLHIVGSSATYVQPATIVLTITGQAPSTGIYYGWNNTFNMIQGITDQQTAGNQITLTVAFADPYGKAVGTYQDTIEVEMALDAQGKSLIAGSPQIIQVTYQVDYPPSSLASVNPVTAVAGGPGFMLTVTGQGFPADAQVQWNGSPLATTWVSSTTLQAQVPASAIAQPGYAQLTSGAPDQQASAPLTFPVANTQALVLQGGLDCAWDPVHGVLYTCLVNATSPLGPAIQGLDPATGKVVAQVACGSGTYPPLVGPSCLAISDDGGYLYAFVYNLQPDVPGTIVRYLLPTLTLDATFSVPVSSGTSNWVMAMAVAPGAPHTLAVVLGDNGNAAGVEILDDGVLRGSVVLAPATPFYEDTLAWGTDASTLYVLSGTWTNPYQLSTLAVAADGPTVLATQPVALNNEAWDIHWVPATGYVYAGSGQVFDPATGNQVGTCASGTAWAMATDLGQGLGFYLTQAPTQINPSTWGVQVLSQKLATFGPQDATFVPVGMMATGSLPPPTRVLRCGPSTLVLYGGEEFLNPIYVLTGPFAQGQ